MCEHSSASWRKIVISSNDTERDKKEQVRGTRHYVCLQCKSSRSGDLSVMFRKFLRDTLFVLKVSEEVGDDTREEISTVTVQKEKHMYVSVVS